MLGDNAARGWSAGNARIRDRGRCNIRGVRTRFLLACLLVLLARDARRAVVRSRKPAQGAARHDQGVALRRKCGGEGSEVRTWFLILPFALAVAGWPAPDVRVLATGALTAVVRPGARGARPWERRHLACMFGDHAGNDRLRFAQATGAPRATRATRWRVPGAAEAGLGDFGAARLP